MILHSVFKIGVFTTINDRAFGDGTEAEFYIFTFISIYEITVLLLGDFRAVLNLIDFAGQCLGLSLIHI